MNAATASLPESLPLTVRVLHERLGEDIRVLNVREVSSVTDYFVIATCTGVPHLRALAEDLRKAYQEKRTTARRRGGNAESGWVVMDQGDVITHLMTRELREFYELEQLWSDAKTLRVESILGGEGEGLGNG